MMTPEMKAARTAFEQRIEATQAALKSTAEYKSYEEAREQLRKFDDIFGPGEASAETAAPAPTNGRAKGTATATATVRRGPKPGQPRNKPGPKPKTDKPVKAKTNTSVGRNAVLSRERPPLKEAMVNVMGDKEMSAGDVIEALTKRNWAPAAAKPKEYIGFMFSKNSDTFQNVSRGIWKVKANVLRKASKAAATPRAKAVPSEAADVSPPKSTDEALSELGISKDGVEENPFR